VTIDEARAACAAKGTMDAFADAVGDLIAAFRGAGMMVGAMAQAFEHEADALWDEEEREDEASA
jgi:hypothetical protein